MLKLSEDKKQNRAAIAYFLYGVVYLIGAILELDPSRKITFWGFVPWWSFYVVGALIIMSLPYFIMRGVRWLTWVLAFFVTGKAVWLLWIQARNFHTGIGLDAYNIFFSLVAATAATLLWHAAIQPGNQNE